MVLSNSEKQSRYRARLSPFIAKARVMHSLSKDLVQLEKAVVGIVKKCEFILHEIDKLNKEIKS